MMLGSGYIAVSRNLYRLRQIGRGLWSDNIKPTTEALWEAIEKEEGVELKQLRKRNGVTTIMSVSEQVKNNKV